MSNKGLQRIAALNFYTEGPANTGLPCTINVFFIDDETLVVTGGYDEQGPGSVLRINLNER